jgi:hypothetical protein
MIIEETQEATKRPSKNGKDAKGEDSFAADEDKQSAPMHTIDFCLSMLKEIVSQRGETPFSRKDAAILLGKSESNISTKMASCGQYGLIVNDRGVGYKLTNLYSRIELPTSIEDKQTALLTALKNPPVYSQLIDENNNKVLPATEVMFSNLLVTTYKLLRKTAESAAPVFLRNAKSLGVLDQSNRLRFIMPIVGPTREVNDEDDGDSRRGVNSSEKPLQNNSGAYGSAQSPDSKMFELPVDLGEKIAYLRYPRDISLEEIETLKIMIDASLKSLELRKKKNKTPADSEG